MALNLALVISGDAAGAKQAARETRTEVQGLGTDAAATSRTIQAANDQAAASARRAIDALTAQTAAERNLRSVIDQRLGISGNVSRIGDPFAQAAGRGADVTAYGQALDRLRARYNPLFAAIQQYRTFQAEIRADYARGVISSEEYAAALSRERQATLANIAALKGRQTAMSGLAAGNFRATNLGYQGFDIAQGLMSGMPLSMIAAQQGPQIAQLYAGAGGVKALTADLKTMASGAATATIAVLGTTGAIATGFGAAAVAAGAYYLSTREKAKELNDILLEQKEIVRALAPAYQELARAGQGPFENISVARLALQSNLDDARKLLKDQQQSALDEARGTSGTFLSLFGMLPEGAQSMLGRSQTSIEFDRIIASASKGEISINDARTALADFAQEHPDFSYIIGRFISMTNMAAATERQVKSLEDTLGRLVNPNRASVGGPGAMDRAQEAGRDNAVMRQRFGDDPFADLREQQRQKEVRLAEAQDQRKRSLDQTMASARMDLVLIGQTTAATEAARMQFQLESQIREEAARNNVDVDQAELDRVARLSAAYGELVAVKQAADAIKGQIDNLTNLRLELLLVGQNETVRARAKAQLEAELQIRKLGIDAYGDEAEMMRQAYERSADLTAELRKQADAWGMISDAAGSGIDRLVDSAANGFRDIDDALEEIGKDLLKTSLQMAVGNPLKNWLTGSDLPEFGDLKSMGGALGRLFGMSPQDPAAAVSSVLAGQSTAMMNVQAAVVNINGGGLGGGLGDNVSRLLGGANDNYAPGAVTRAPLADIGETAFKAAGVTKTGIPLSQIGARGLVAKVNSAYADRFQGLLNDLSAAGYPIKSLGEGGYSYRNVAGSSNLSNHAFGNALDINPRQNPWAVGAKGNFGQYGIDPDALARKNGLFWGGNWNKSDAMHFQVDKTAQSLDKLATSSTNVSDSLTNGLGKLGQSLGGGGPAASLAQLGSPDFKANTTLSAILGDNRPGAGQAAGNGWFGGIFNFIPKLLEGILGFIPKLLQGLFSFIPNMLGGIFSFDGGGYTGAGPKDKPAGVVHKGEIVWSQDDIRNAGGEHVVEAMRLGRRGYASGGVVEGGYPMSARGAASGSAGYVSAQSEAPQINIYPQAGVETKTRKRKGPRGGDVTDIIVSAVKQSVVDGDLDSTLGGRFGVAPVRARRGTL